jgi:threonine synthase
MLFYSTSKKSNPAALDYAVLKGLADDGGLYMPQYIPTLSDHFIRNLNKKTLKEISFEVASAFLAKNIPLEILHSITEDAMNFPIPLVQLEKNVHSLELFHGPTMAFKDVGARFMSRLMAYLHGDNERRLKVVVATSGDTGSAVAAGFFNIPGIEVTVLFPKGKVSNLQQKQITTWGHNIDAIEIDGTFDDCQKLAKQVLVDEDLNDEFLITSANSINIARLIPQIFYYFHAAAQAEDTHNLVFSVPSGNFGNLSAGLMAAAMGLPVKHFIAATNINDVVHQYNLTGVYTPRPSLQTISNAMDVGNPSNFARMMDLYESSHHTFTQKIYTCSFTDEQTLDAVHQVLKDYNYLMDPHGAVAWLGAKNYLEKKDRDARIIFLETAHPAKFPQTLDLVMKLSGNLPEQLQKVADKEEVYTSLPNDFGQLKKYLSD